MKKNRDSEENEAHLLVERVKRGDREAFMKIVHLYQRSVFILAYSYFHDEEDALDVVQETFLRFYQKAHQFKPSDNFKNWLFKIAKNLCIDYFRKNHQRSQRIVREKMILTTSGIEKDNSQSELKEIFAHCLDALSERQRMVFLMRHFNQFEYAEIAKILNVALGTVKSLHFKAIRNLRTMIGHYLGREK